MASKLQNALSLYLRAHKESKIDWWPWSKEALQEALRSNKPIFISIGYVGSALSQRMHEELFASQETITLLNQEYICILVDKDERSDIDSYYQGLYKLLNNSQGGWPTSVFLTPHNEPIVVRSYMQEDSSGTNAHSMGFLDLAKEIVKKVKDTDEALYKNAKEAKEYLQKITHPKEATHLKEEFYINFLLQAKENFDTENGGFMEKPKFHHTTILSMLLRISKEYQDSEAKAMLTQTLDAMKNGALYDFANGGFFRYCQDAQWQEASLEKRVVENALLIGLYTDTFLQTQEFAYLQVAKKSADFLSANISQNALFWSALQYEDTTLQRVSINKTLHANATAMMITALCKLGKIDQHYKAEALKSLEALLQTFFIDGELYSITYADQKPQIKAFLDTYVFVSEALLEVFEMSGDELHLIMAQRLANRALELFYAHGMWYFSRGDFETVATISDRPNPSPVSCMVGVLLRLTHHFKDEKYKHFAFKTLEYNSFELARKPILAPNMLQELLSYLKK